MVAHATILPGSGRAPAQSGSLDLLVARQKNALRGGDITPIVQHNRVFDKKENIWVPRSNLLLPDDPYWHAGRDGDGGGGGGRGGGGSQQSQSQPQPGEEQEGEGQGAGPGQGDLNLSPKEFLELYLGPFELPNWQRKDLLEQKDMRWRRKGIQRHGSVGRLDKRQTQRQRLRRAGAEKWAHPDKYPGRIIPGSDRVPFEPERDFRFGRLIPEPDPDAIAVMYCLLDGSYSTKGEPLQIAQNAFFVLVKALRLLYKKVVTVMVSHTETPLHHETEEAFFALDATGGTQFSPTFLWMDNDARKRFPKGKCNRYWAHFTDGDNSSSDKEPQKKALSDLMLREFNHGFYLEFKSTTATTKWSDGGESILELPEEIRQHISMAKVTSRKDLRAALRKLLGIDR